MERSTAKVYKYRVFFEYDGKSYGDTEPFILSGFKDLAVELKESPRCFINTVEFCVCSWLNGENLLVEDKPLPNIIVMSEDGAFLQNTRDLV